MLGSITKIVVIHYNSHYTHGISIRKKNTKNNPSVFSNSALHVVVGMGCFYEFTILKVNRDIITIMLSSIKPENRLSYFLVFYFKVLSIFYPRLSLCCVVSQ